MYFTISLTSASFKAACGVIGTTPQTPEPPLMIFFTSLSIVVSAAGAYFAATSLYAGPIVAPVPALSRRWQVVQSLAPIISNAFSLPALTVGDAAGVAVAAVSFVSEVLAPPFPQATARAAHAITKNVFFIINNCNRIFEK